jgi:hypothetical protein
MTPKYDATFHYIKYEKRNKFAGHQRLMPVVLPNQKDYGSKPT